MPPSLTREEVRAQLVRAGRYFGRGLRLYDKRALAVRCGGSVIVVARDGDGDRLAAFAADTLGLDVEHPNRYQQQRSLLEEHD